MDKSVLHVQLLGGFSLQLGEKVIPPLPSRSAASLFAFLILHRDKPQTRDLVAGRRQAEGLGLHHSDHRAGGQSVNVVATKRGVGRDPAGRVLVVGHLDV